MELEFLNTRQVVTFNSRHKRLSILGTRGIPACHGGFETFAEQLAQYLVARGWQVTVYCQEEGAGPIHENEWRGIRLLHIPVATGGCLGTILYDWKSVMQALREHDTVLTLGYNTAVFSALLRLRHIPNLMNMDGIEWKRRKWGPIAKAWLYLNEWIGAHASNHLIADHPEIKHHLMRHVSAEKITTIPYSADSVESADAGLLEGIGVVAHRYALVIARPEPENSILEIVSAFSKRWRGRHLVVLGRLEPDKNSYHRSVMAAAGEEVLFPGAVYDGEVVRALRYYTSLYIHGHTVGGCNPSLVEALAAGSPVLAHDNAFNRWVAGPEAWYFEGGHECAYQLDALLDNSEELDFMRAAGRERFRRHFNHEQVYARYARLLEHWGVVMAD